MQITHPQSNYNNLPPENVFIAVDEMNTEVGVGTIEYQYLPHRSPDRPVQLYFSLDCQPGGWYMLMGALLARARQLRDTNPELPARMYTRVNPGNSVELNRFESVGMNCNQFESLIALKRLPEEPRSPMGFSYGTVPLNTLPEQQAFVARLAQNDIFHIDVPYLQYLQRMPHFSALCLRCGNDIASEVLVAGSGDACEMMAVYTAQPYRRQGLAKRLINQAMTIMAAEGVERFASVLMSLSEPQKHLAMSFHGSDVQMQNVFPSMDL